MVLFCNSYLRDSFIEPGSTRDGKPEAFKVEVAKKAFKGNQEK